MVRNDSEAWYGFNRDPEVVRNDSETWYGFNRDPQSRVKYFFVHLPGGPKPRRINSGLYKTIMIVDDKMHLVIICI